MINKHVDIENFFKLPDVELNGGMYSSAMNQIHYGLRNRVERAILFLGAMRNTPFIPLKIALGMNILECLFSDASFVFVCLVGVLSPFRSLSNLSKSNPILPKS